MERAWTVVTEVLLGVTLVTVALPTVVCYRGLLQSRYEWGLFGVRGVGVRGSWWIIALVAAAGWLILAWNHRRPGRWAFGFLAAWHGALFANVFYHAIGRGSGLTLRGDAIGVALNLAILGPLLVGTCWLASLVLFLRAWRGTPQSPAPLDPGGKRCLGVGVALSVVVAALFFQGDGIHHTGYDRLAIAVVVAQSLLIGAALQGGAASKREG